MSEETTVDDTAISSDGGPQLYAGKFKSVEDLEKAYKEGFAVHIKNKELEDRINEYKTVPEIYELPEGVSLRDNKIKEMKDLAKTSGLNQSQFQEAVKKLSNDYASQLNVMEERRSSIGEEKINVIKGYVENKFSGFDDSFRENVLNQVINDNTMMEKVMSDRDKNLNSQAPGGSSVSASSPKLTQLGDMRKACFEAAQRSLADPRDKTKRSQLINICREVGHARKEG